ncbi:uncharacterized protein BNAC04G50880D isoform X2 [Brassica napus]|uniref:uncharacterized protein BNAC04G50880D isoform X2 n=1 Tax=Brassica napus TaxID=3708 RepID=UPI0006AA98E9|nr:uncharacterized protein BNAC04G50880D isoform X2 [Brassica napus]XP_013717042.1 uncharacterized protein BNAC04G50880D isoform X2 [Brassica napus]
MMAAGEARAVWQRTVNRYLVQEDAKRAPKFTSSHSSSSTKQLLDHHPHHLHVKTPLEAEVNLSEKKPELGAKETKESYDSFGKDESSEIPFDPTSPWNPLSSEKAGPWWRTTDKDELASLVAQRSLDFVENCNLPTPQKMKRSSYYGSSPHEQGPSSCKNRREEASSSSECDLSKSELLEALRRSQTRAREAENMAKEACAEKEDLVKLLFKQASELFGYRQLMQLLQLEALYLQIKNKKIEKPPRDSIPWKGRKEGRKRRSKRGKASGLFGLALGMSLVGAGLLLGWTVGWMQILSF